jgi:hypothetical protein
MTNYIPTIIVDKIVYPGEAAAFNIKKPDEIAMVQQYMLQQKTFGIIPSIDGLAQEYGTLFDPLTNIFSAQTLQVQGVGLKVFRILEPVQQEKNDKQCGAIVTYPDNTIIKVQPQLSNLILEEVKRFYIMLNIESMISEDMDWNAYSIAHQLGLSIEQEYQLLTIFNEIQRLEYLRRYLKHIVPEVHNLDLIRSRINLN